MWQQFTLLCCHVHVRQVVYLKLWIEGKKEGLPCAIKAIADFKGLGRQCTKHLETKPEMFAL